MSNQGRIGTSYLLRFRGNAAHYGCEIRFAKNNPDLLKSMISCKLTTAVYASSFHSKSVSRLPYRDLRNPTSLNVETHGRRLEDTRIYKQRIHSVYTYQRFMTCRVLAKANRGAEQERQRVPGHEPHATTPKAFRKPLQPPGQRELSSAGAFVVLHWRYGAARTAPILFVGDRQW